MASRARVHGPCSEPPARAEAQLHYLLALQTWRDRLTPLASTSSLVNGPGLSQTHQNPPVSGQRCPGPSLSLFNGKWIYSRSHGRSLVGLGAQMSVRREARSQVRGADTTPGVQDTHLFSFNQIKSDRVSILPAGGELALLLHNTAGPSGPSWDRPLHALHLSLCRTLVKEYTASEQ